MVIAIDFDGTIVEHRYPEIGKPVPFAIEVLKKLQEEHILILWTVREGKLLDEALQYCLDNGIKFYAANKNHPEEEPGDSPRKLSVDLFIDDRNLGGLPDWGVIYRIMQTGGDNLFRFESLLDSDEGNRRPSKKNFFIRLGETWDRMRGRSY